MVEVVATILAMKEWCINADITGKTALAWAAVGGQVDVIKLFTEQEDINSNDTGTGYPHTPLLFAAEGENRGIVKLLSGREDIELNTVDAKYGVTKLLLTSINGREGRVGLRLEPEDIDSKISRLSPLLWAARVLEKMTMKEYYGNSMH